MIKTVQFELYSAAHCAVAARLSELIYLDNLKDNLEAAYPEKIEAVEVFPIENFFAAIVDMFGIRAVVFQGSNDRKDWLYNINATTTGHALGNVHSGFYDAFSTLWDEMRRSVMATERPILFTGHSLGGALACLGMAEFLMCRPNQPFCGYTFGCPRVLGTDAALQVKSAARGRIHRVVNYLDPVCRMPTPWRFRHVGLEHYISKKGKMLGDVPWWRHMMGLYSGAKKAYQEKDLGLWDYHAKELYVEHTSNAVVRA